MGGVSFQKGGASVPWSVRPQNSRSVYWLVNRSIHLFVHTPVHYTFSKSRCRRIALQVLAWRPVGLDSVGLAIPSYSFILTGQSTKMWNFRRNIIEDLKSIFDEAIESLENAIPDCVSVVGCDPKLSKWRLHGSFR